MVLSPLKDVPEKLKGVEVDWTTIKGEGGESETKHACIWTMRSSQPAYAATFRGEGKKMKTVGNAFVTDQCTKFIFALLLCWFYLIRTQAFSVFSEVSSHVAAPQWDRTIHKCQRVGNSNCMNKRDGLWMTLCSFLIVTRFFFLLFIAFSTPLSLQRWLCSPLLSHHHSFFFLIFSCSLSSLTQGGLWLEAMQRCAQLSVRPLPLLSYSSLACAQCFFVFFFNKTRLHLLLLQGFYRKRIKKKRLN